MWICVDILFTFLYVKNYKFLNSIHLNDYFKSSKNFTIPIYFNLLQIKLMSNYAAPLFFKSYLLWAEEIRCVITWESRYCADLSGDKPQLLGFVSMDLIGVAFPHANGNVFFPSKSQVVCYMKLLVKWNLILKWSRIEDRKKMNYPPFFPRDSWEISNSLC